MEIRRTKCKKYSLVRQETFNWLAKNPSYTRRFAWYVGKRCQASTISAVAEELQLDWKAVKELEKEYMEEKLKRRGEVNPEVIGIDEISIRKGHSYKIAVTDLVKKFPIWLGGLDRSEDSMNQFYEWLGVEKCKEIRLAVMDMWKAFEKSAKDNIPQAAILYDKFHVMRHLGEALDKIRKTEYKRVSEKNRKFIKGQKYTLLSKWENLNLDGKKALKTLFSINKRLNKAYILKESFGQLWSYNSESWARKFFEN
jgi:transposase